MKVSDYLKDSILGQKVAVEYEEPELNPNGELEPTLKRCDFVIGQSAKYPNFPDNDVRYFRTIHSTIIFTV